MLRRNSAIIDLRTETLSLFTNGHTWTVKLVGSDQVVPDSIHQQIRKINYIHPTSIIEQRIDDTSNEDLWSQKIQEIRDFWSGITGEKLTINQANKLINIYNKYKSVFSDEPGKVKNFQCTLQFRDTVDFNRKSYPIAQSRKQAVRAEIEKMINRDIIESSHSPYTSPIEMCIRDRPINCYILRYTVHTHLNRRNGGSSLVVRFGCRGRLQVTSRI